MLLSAVFDKNMELCKLLIEHGANPDFAPSPGNTPLLTACHGADRRIVEFLLSLGVNVNKQNDDGQTALDAIRQRQAPPDYEPEVLKRMIKLGRYRPPPHTELAAVEALLLKHGAKTGKELAGRGKSQGTDR